MARGSATVTVKITGENRLLKRALRDSESALGRFGGRVKSGLATLGRFAAAATAAGAAATAGFAVKAVKAASDLEETLSKVGVVFGASARQVTGFADQMADAFGLPKQEMLDAAANIGLVGKAAGLAEPAAAQMSTQMAQLAADASSFFNVPLPTALEKIRSGLVGEAEPLRTFGVLLSAAAVEAKAVELGIAAAGEELTEQQKVMARAAIITEQMSDASGDLERTQDSLANRLRALRGRAENFAASVGTRLIPVVSAALDKFEDFAKVVADRLGPVFDRVAAFWRRSGPGIVAAAKGFATQAVEAITGTFGRIGEFLSGLVIDLKPLADRLLSQARGLVGQIAEGIRSGDPSMIGRAIGDAVVTALGTLQELSGQIMAAFRSLFGDINWAGLGKQVGKHAIPFLLGFVTSMVNEAIPQTFRFLKDHWVDALLAALSFAALPGKLLAGLTSTLARIPLVGRLLAWGSRHFHEFGRGLWRLAGDAMKAVGRGIREAVDIGAPRWLGDFVARMQLFPDFLKHWRGLLAAGAGEALENMGRAIGAKIETVLIGLRLLRDRIVGFFANVGGWLVRHGEHLMSGFLNGVRGRFKAVVDWVAGIGGRVRSAVGDMGGVLYGAGRDLIMGMLRGIRAMAGRLADAVIDQVSSAVNRAKSFLGIRSPSKVFEEIGRQTVEGFNIGVAQSKVSSIDKLLAGGTSSRLDSHRQTSPPTSAASRGPVFAEFTDLQARMIGREIGREMAMQARSA